MFLKTNILVLCLLLGIINAFGQADSGIVQNGKISAVVQSNGSLFSQKNGQALCHFAGDNQLNLIKFAGQWMVGVKGTTIYANKNDHWAKPQLWPGPIDTVTNLPKSAVEWSKIWTITRAEVQEHRANYNKSGYQVTDHILNWPARHNDNNISAFMAPYIDWNVNGIYDPENGDYPSFPGDVASYFIANDLFGENVFSQGNKLGIEIQGMVYAFQRPDLANTLFVKLYLINRSDNDYAPFYFGQYVDYQLGNSNDNVVATDVTRNVIYGYNGDDFDENGFGNTLPSAGCVFLNNDLYASHIFYQNDSVRGLPTTEAQMLSVMEGRWRNNSPKYALEKGVSGTAAQVTRFVYPKKTDDRVSSYNWSDEKSTDTIGSRKMLGAIKYDQFVSKAYKRIDLAFVFAQSGEEGESELLNQVDETISFYTSSLRIPSLKGDNDLLVYPNPMNLNEGNIFNINALSVVLTDNTGKKLVDLEPVDMSEKKFSIPCSEKLASGVYYLKAVTSSGLSYKKVILISN